MRTMKNQKKHFDATSKNNNRPYIVRNAAGEEFLLPNYSESFRALMDDKEIIIDMLNSILNLEPEKSIKDVKYEFEKPIDVFMPENDPIRLDAWAETKDNRFINIEVQNWPHAFLFDRMQLYNAYLTLRSKYDFNKSKFFETLSQKERKRRMYELPETISIWLCNFPILKSKDYFKDSWAVYSENDIRAGAALPIFPKNKYIIIDLPKFVQLRKSIHSREDFWLRLLSKGPVEMSCPEDSLCTRALNRLRLSNVDPKILQTLEVAMSEDKHVMEVIKADAYLKGEAKGIKDGMKKGMKEGLQKGMEKGMEKGLAQGMEKGLQKGMEKGAKQERAKIVARDKKIEEFLRSKGVSPELLTAALAIK